MSARFLLIDGYNLMYAAGFCQAEYAPGDLLRCRTRLIVWLLEKLTPSEIARATVVFDSREPPPDRPNRVTIQGLSVLFAREEREADALIERLIEQHSSPKQVTVVSSDHRLHKAARARRCDAIDSEKFLDEKDRRVPRAVNRDEDGRILPEPLRPGTPVAPATRGPTAAGSASPPTPPPRPPEADDWLSIFGGIDTKAMVPDSELPPVSDAPSKPKTVPAAAPAAPGKPRPTARPELPEAEDVDGWLGLFSAEQGKQPGAGEPAPRRVAGGKATDRSSTRSAPAETGQETPLARRRLGLDRLPTAAPKSGSSGFAAGPGSLSGMSSGDGPGHNSGPETSQAPVAGEQPVEESSVEFWLKTFGEVEREPEGGTDATRGRTPPRKPRNL